MNSPATQEKETLQEEMEVSAEPVEETADMPTDAPSENPAIDADSDDRTESADVYDDTAEEADIYDDKDNENNDDEDGVIADNSNDDDPVEQISVDTENTNPMAVKPNIINPGVPYHRRYYLKYRDSKKCTPLDINGTMSFLQDLGFNGGQLKKARESKGIAEFLRSFDENKSNRMFCSYCGTPISGVEFFRLPDGRLRCSTCSSSVVETKEEIEDICKRVIANMDSFFGATLEVPVSIQVVDERKLKKKIGVPLGTRDSQSMLILGVAINKKHSYSVILENGAPRISLIATFAHELTHIWQYTHWDNKKGFKKCPKKLRLLIYEGMAKWVELQYLYLIGETTIAKREELITRNRQDEYGVGFCIYEDRYPLSRETMNCEETPFTTDRYPLD